MSIRDGECQLSASQAVTVDAVSTNSYDLGAADLEVGAGEPLVVDFDVEVDAEAAGGETYTFEVIESAAAALTSPTVLASRTIPAADLVVGFAFQIPIPAGSVTKRYLGTNYDTGGTAPAITVSAFLQPRSMSAAKYTAYPDAVNIS